MTPALLLNKGETIEAFVTRLENSSEGPKTSTIQFSFIEPGLVNYEDIGNVLVQKPCLDKMAQSFIGKPIINEIHKSVIPADFYKSGKADGIVTRVWYNEQDGWYWGEGIVWDEPTRKNCRAFAVSCAYTMKDGSDKKGLWHNVPYEGEILDGEYTHLAIVKNPRYEGSRIILCNSKEEGGSMKWNILKWFRKGVEVKNANDLEKAVADIDGVNVPVKELIDTYKAEQVEVAEKARLERESADPLDDETVIEIDGAELPLKNLKESYKNRRKAQMANSDEAKAKEEEERKNSDEAKAKEEAEKKAKEEEERKNAADAEEKAKADKEAEDKKKKEDDEKQNALKAEEAKRTERFNSLRHTATLRGEPQKIVMRTREEKLAAGKDQYGK